MSSSIPPRDIAFRFAACLSLAMALVALPATALAQGTDTLRLATLHRLTEARDPRAGQDSLLVKQAALRNTTLQRERYLPQVGATATGQYLSDVARVPVPGALGPLNQQYDTYVSLRQPLYDPTWSARSAIDQAQTAEAQAALRSTLWQQRQQVNDAYFGILARDAQARTLSAAIADLTERRRVAAERVAAGAALASDVALLDAELARRRQSLDETRAEGDAARAVLSSLVGQPITSGTVLALPPTDTLLPTPARDRPEFTLYDKSRAVLDARAASLGAQRLPRLSATGRTGYGRPGLNQLGREFDTYYVAGLQLEWSPWNWGATQRDREVQLLQSRIVDTQEAALADGIARLAASERARISALARSLAADDGIIALREQVLQETRRRVDEGDATSADYIARQTELVSAQLDRETRRVRLAEARARYLTTIGREVQ